MLLKEILKNVEVKEIKGYIDGVEIEYISTDTDKIKSGTLFVCIVGSVTDSHKMVSSIRNDVVAFITEYEVETEIPQIIVKSSRKALGIMASTFYGEPQLKMQFIGITGTNGKTSVSYFVKNILETAGKKVGVIGTLGAKILEEEYKTDLTTPDVLTLYALLNEMQKKGVEYVVAEVSAHALDMMRVEGIYFKIAVFTNLTQDHLDYFGNIENYKNAKLKLFDEKVSEYAVVNADDATGREIQRSGRKNVVTYGLENPADVFAIDVKEKADGMSFVLNVNDDIYDVTCGVVGRFNLYNVLASATVAEIVGIERDKMFYGLTNIQSVPGRMERVADKNGAVIYVDYAHTPDGLENALKTARSICRGRLVCLFGCGGNRDKSKRSIMGEKAGEYADFTVLTSDNPRYEEPMLIIGDIENGLRKRTDKYVVVQNREHALNYAVKYISGEDVLLVCGKGAENYQEVLGVKHPFSDKKIINNLLSK